MQELKIQYPDGWALNYDVANNTATLVAAGGVIPPLFPPNPVPTPAPTPAPTPPPSGGLAFPGPTPYDRQYTQAPPVSGQVRPQLDALSAWLFLYIEIPPAFPFAGRPLNINHLGFVHVAEVPGHDVIPHELVVTTVAGAVLYENVGAGDTAPGFNFTINNPNGFVAAGAQLNINSSDRYLVVRVRNPTWNYTVRSGILVDIAYPWRY